MSTETGIRPETILSPHLVCDDSAAAIDFYVRLFGAEELVRLPTPDGRLMYAAVRIGGSTVMLSDAQVGMSERSPKAIGGTSVTMHLEVEDVDAVVDAAAGAGARVVMPAADMFWGDRYAIIEDPAGHRWSLAKTIRTMTMDELRAAADAAMCGATPGTAA